MADVRVRAFVDFWNFQLAIRREIGDVFRVDWSRLGPWLAQKAGALTLEPQQHSRVRYEGLNVYLSYSPSSSKDAKLLHWAINVLDRFPGVHVVEKEARPKNPPNCPSCHTQVDTCPHCGSGMSGTVEKGIDTAIVTDMIKLAWENSYDVAVLVSNDRDFIPAVEFLASKGRKVINAAFPPSGMELARRCWASFDLRKEGIPSLPNAIPQSPASIAAHAASAAASSGPVSTPAPVSTPSPLSTPSGPLSSSSPGPLSSPTPPVIISSTVPAPAPASDPASTAVAATSTTIVSEASVASRSETA